MALFDDNKQQEEKKGDKEPIIPHYHNHKPEILWVDTSKDITGDIIKKSGYKFKSFKSTTDCVQYISNHSNKTCIRGIITADMRNQGAKLDGIGMIKKIYDEWHNNHKPVTAVVSGLIKQTQCDKAGVDILCNYHAMADVRERVQELIVTEITSISRQHIKTYHNDDSKADEYSVNIHAQEISLELHKIYTRPYHDKKKIHILSKRVYKHTKRPAIIDRHRTLDHIKNRHHEYKDISLNVPIRFHWDRAFDKYKSNESEFIKTFCDKFNIPSECLIVHSTQPGSTLLDVTITNDAKGNKLLVDIEAKGKDSPYITQEKAEEEFAEIGMFMIQFGPCNSSRFTQLKYTVIMNPQWDRAYATEQDDNLGCRAIIDRQGKTNWTGALDDGKSRGGEPYYCPRGWKRFAVQFEEQDDDFDHIYDKWPIAYHGTKFDFTMMITLSGLKVTCGSGVYLSPCIEYSAHPRYAKPVKLDLSKAKQAEWSSEYINEFSKYDGKWVQVVFACRVKPGSFTKQRETMSMTPPVKIHPDYSNDSMEWIVTEKHGNIVGPDRILIYGIMIRASDEYPLSLPESHWWNSVKWYNYKNDY